MYMFMQNFIDLMSYIVYREKTTKRYHAESKNKKK